MRRLPGGRIWGALVVVAATLSLTGGVAQASSLSFVRADTQFQQRVGVAYSADPGERNNLVVSWNPATGTFKLTDYGVVAVLPDLEVDELLDGYLAPTLANAPQTLSSCVFLLKSVTCRGPAGAFPIAFVSLGDGDDHAFAGTWPGDIAIGGDAGTDTIEGGLASEAVLAGGSGDDVLNGGSGQDDLFGGPGADRLQGGAGIDRAIYWHDVAGMSWRSWEADNPTTGVSASLDGVADDGQPGEGDDIASDVEGIVGTWFDDTLTGSAGANTLDGHYGNDMIEGGGGADKAIGYYGNDTLQLNDGEADRYRCGFGDDVAHVDEFDLFDYTSQPNDCESIVP